MRRLALATAAMLLRASCGERAAADDQGLHNDIVNNNNGAEVTFDATVLADPVQSGGHERFEVKTATGETLEIDNNITLAASVPIHAGDTVVIHGELYIDPSPKVGVPCTHATTSSGCQNSGGNEFTSNYYE